MAAKTLSNGTLSLRFMQNAQRAKQQTQIQAEQAKINDDAEWHVSQEVRDSWRVGPSSSSSQASNSVIQETSYLPFIFTKEPESTHVQAIEESPHVFKGRRSFKRGKEVTGEEAQIPIPKQSPPKSTTSQPGRRPATISGFKSNSTQPPKKPTAVRSIIAQEADVGTDMKSARRQKLNSPSQPPPTIVNSHTGFMKPAGIDAPPEAVEVPAAPISSLGSKSRADSIIQLAKSQTNSTLRKRSRNEAEILRTFDEPTGTPSNPSTSGDSAPKKRKKKSAISSE